VVPKDGKKLSVEEGLGGSSRLADPQMLDRVVANLRVIQRGSGLQKALTIGELILEHFYGGDPREWRNRRRNKDNSIRGLAARSDCPFSKSTLNEAVTVYVASRALPCVRTFGHIGAAHVAAVLKLPPDEREAMLARAERERMGIREFRLVVMNARHAAEERHGAPVADNEEHLLFALGRRLVEARQHLLQLSRLSRVPSTFSERLTSLANDLASAAADLDRLRRSSPGRETGADAQRRSATERSQVDSRASTGGWCSAPSELHT
jgi:hypothetical protein